MVGVLLVIHLLVTEDGCVGSLGRVITTGIFINHRVERRTAFLPTLLEVQQIRHGVLDLIDRWPVFLDDTREFELSEVLRLEILTDLLIEVRGKFHRLLVARTTHAARTDSF